jgi:tetratricopeptide (TPR) repeat protein
MMSKHFRTLSFVALLAAFPLCQAQAGLEDVNMDGISLSGSYLAGRFASKQRDVDVAARYFGEALRDDPNNSILIERAFVLELSAGNIASAEEFATQVLFFNSQHRMARIVLGLRDVRHKHYKQAREHFAKASYTPVGELTSALLTAWTYAGEGDLNKALKALDKLDSNDSFANFKSFHAALLTDYLNSPLRADAAYKKAYGDSGTSLRMVQAYGNFLERQGRKDEARKVYTDFLAGSEKNPLIATALADLDAGKTPKRFIASPLQGIGEALFSLASALSDDQGLDIALVYAQLALSVESDRDIAQTLLGDIYEDMERYDKAVAAYDLIPKTSVLRTNADIEIAVNEQRLERPKEAQARLRALIAREPSNYEAITTLANLLRNNEEFAESAKVYSQALALAPNPGKENWTAFYYRGISYERTGQWDKAEADFRQALKFDPQQALVLNYLGYSLIDRGMNLTEAMGMVKKAVELKPNDGYIVDSLGWAHYKLGEYDEAVKNLERAVELKPADPIIGDHLGDCYWRVGRKLEAQFQWQHARDNKPNPEDLTRIEKKLKDGLPDEPPVKPAQNATATGGNG